MQTPASPSSRATAAGVVTEWLKTGTFPDRLLMRVSADRGFVAEMVYGVARWLGLYDWIIEHESHRAPDLPVRSFLLIGLHQLLHMDSVPDYAAVSSTVQAAKQTAPFAAGYINRILRRIATNRGELMESLRQAPPHARLSHPPLLLQRWRAAWGETKMTALCEWDNRTPELVAHPDLRRTDVPSFVAALNAAGIDAVPHATAGDSCVVIPHGTAVPDIPGYAEGLFTVRDPSTSLAVQLLDPQPGERVLDACAAPGGKTCVLAQRVSDAGTVVALDVSAARLAPLRDNVARLGLHNVTIVPADAADPKAFSSTATAAPFDSILLDVPCTNTGVLRRRPDARWRFTHQSLAQAVAAQRAILNACAPRLKPGGALVYSTCSLEPEEGERLVSEWLKEHSGWTLDKQVVLFPPESGTDGAFCTRLTRNG